MPARPKYTIKDMQILAKRRSGTCLSKVNKGENSKLTWSCSKGHTWDATPGNIRSGHWCPSCAGQSKPTIQDLNDLARQNNGICLSKRYINAHSKLKWKCDKGHVWMTTPHVIKMGSWCPVCIGQVKPTIKEMIKLAKAKGGICLSKEYITNKTKLKWRCKNRHVWMAVPSDIKSGKWCPICSSGIGERICRKYFEAIFKCKFLKHRPKWLINSRGNQMELDGYSRTKRIAFEYQGQQHVREVLMFHKIRTFKEQKNDDKLKKKLCTLRKIALIRVPYFYDFKEMGKWIISRSKKLNLISHKFNRKINHLSFDVFSPKQLEEMQRIAMKKGGKCLSDIYVNAHTKLKWKCSKEHIWEAIPNSIKKGSWCPYCVRKAKSTLQEMNKFADLKGGRCLSKKYINDRTKLIWSCRENHIWKATPGSIKSGTWCPACAGLVKLTIKQMKLVAKRKKGQCLSKKYVNSKTHLIWKCKRGHIWKASPDNIKRGKWCPICARKRKGRGKSG